MAYPDDTDMKGESYDYENDEFMDHLIKKGCPENQLALFRQLGEGATWEEADEDTRLGMAMVDELDGKRSGIWLWSKLRRMVWKLFVTKGPAAAVRYDCKKRGTMSKASFIEMLKTQDEACAK